MLGFFKVSDLKHAIWCLGEGIRSFSI